MADPRTFISFDFDNNETDKILFSGQAKNSNTPFSISDWSSKSSLPQSQWKAIVSEKIAKCHIMIILVGKKTSSAIGVASEIQMAKAKDVPFFGVYVGGADSSTSLPTGLARNRTIAWEWKAISNAIDQVLKEGKNK